MRFDKLTAYNQYILEEEFCFTVSKYEKFLHNVKVYQTWNKLWSGYILVYICHFHFFLIQWCKLQLGVYIRDHRGKSKLFTKQTRHNHNFLGSCELKAPLYIYIYICQHIGRRLSSQHVDQASFEIMVNISKHDNHVSQQMPAEMSTA